jgi:hypothetical protein
VGRWDDCLLKGGVHSLVYTSIMKCVLLV